MIPLVDAIPPVRGKRGRPRQRPDAVQGDRAYDSEPHSQTDRARRKAELEGRERALAYRLMACAGLRVNECRTLTWGSLDLDSEPAKLTVEAEYAKTRRRDTIPVHPAVAALPRQWRTDVVALRGVLPTAKARVFHIGTHPDRPFARDLTAAGIEAVNDKDEIVDLYSLRHSCATLLTKAGIAPRVVQEIMRHANLTTTMKAYTHIELHDMAGALAALPAVERKYELVRAVANGGTTGGVGCQHICQQFPRAKGQDGATRDKPRHARREGRFDVTPSDVAHIDNAGHDVSTQVGKGEMVGVAGFEPAASCSQSRRANQTALHPERRVNVLIILDRSEEMQ